MNKTPCVRGLLAVCILSAASVASAQTQGDGARVYWKTLAGANAVTFWPMLIGGNANPFDPAHTIAPGTDFDAVLVLAGVHKVLPVAGRSSTLSLFLPMGHLQGEITGLPLSLPSQASRGFGDPVLQMTFNVAGAPAIRNLTQLGRYEPKYTIDALGAVAFPVGEHNDDQLINLGQNRWYGRIGAPVMVALAPWIPGRRTTVEAVPALWFFQDVKDDVGRVLKNGALFQLEGHVTRDFTDSFWASFDASWFAGAKPELAGIEGRSLNTSGVGFTVGFQLNQNFSINTSYFATVSDSASTDLRADELRVMFTYGWHELLEGVKRLGKD